MEKGYEIKILTQKDLINAGCFDVDKIINIVKDVLVEYAKGNLIFPEKTSMIFDTVSQDRINCLIAGIPAEHVYGVKWVSVFPDNPTLRNKQNLSAVILLSELKSGFPIAFMEGTLCSNLRTAAIGALASKYLAKSSVPVIGFLGAGEQAKSHFLAMKSVHPEIKVCKVASRTSASEFAFISQMKKYYPDVEYVVCHSNFEDAARDSDIIVTAISGQEKLLKADWISEGAFYCHVGGLEDDFSVPQKADKIVCDDWEVVKHRTQTISQMYHLGLLTDRNIYGNLHEIIMKNKPGRINDREFIYFNSVGLSFLDVAVANWMYHKAIEKSCGTDIRLQEKSMFDFDIQ